MLGLGRDCELAHGHFCKVSWHFGVVKGGPDIDPAPTQCLMSDGAQQSKG